MELQGGSDVKVFVLRLPVLFARLPPFPELRVFLFLTLASSFAAISIRCMFHALDTDFPRVVKVSCFFFSPRSVEDFSSFSTRMHMVPFFLRRVAAIGYLLTRIFIG